MTDELMQIHKEVVQLTERLTWARANLPTVIELLNQNNHALARQLLSQTIEMIEL